MAIQGVNLPLKSNCPPPLQAVEIDEFGVRARGASQAFLDKLPTASW